MPRHATKTSFKTGHKMSPEVYEKWYQSMLPIWNARKGKMVHNWSKESREKLSKTTKGINGPNTLPLYTERIVKSRGIKYIKIKIQFGEKWQYKHRYIMEQHLGRKLKTKELVHHKNHNSLDNRIENLQIVTTADHNRIHCSINNWSIKYSHCQKCGTAKIKHISHGLCSSCYQKIRLHFTKDHKTHGMKTSLKELIQLGYV